MHVESGKVIVSMLDYGDSIPRTAVPGWGLLSACLCQGFSTISSDGIHGEDLYHVVMWPGDVQAPVVLKQHTEPLPGAKPTGQDHRQRQFCSRAIMR